MDRELLVQKIEAQRAFFAAGKTRPVEARLDALRALRGAIRAMEGEINAALRADLGKSAAESYMCETGMALSEISHLLRHARRYARPIRARTPLAQFCASSRQLACPYGVALVMSPWNYPLMLALEPAADAIAAGNTVVLKPSAYAPNTSEVLQRLVERALPPEWAFVVTGWARGERDAAGLQVRLHLLHRRRQRRPAGHGEGRRAPDAGDARAGREEPLPRRPDGEPRAGREAHRLRQVPQLRADVRRAGLRLLRRSRPRAAGRGAQARRRRAVRRARRSRTPTTAASSTASTSTG